MSLAPQVGKQAIAAQTMVDVMIYGGSAGCVDNKTEFLTEGGWKSIADYTEGDEVCIYNDITDELSFEQPADYIKEPCKDMFKLRGVDLEHVVTEDHCLVYWDKNGEMCETILLDVVDDLVVNPLDYEFHSLEGASLYCTKVDYYVPEDSHKYCFNVSTGYFVVRRNGHTIITGNSGKSRLLLLKAGFYAHTDPNFEGVMFRRTTTPLSAAGGLFSEAKKLFRPLGIDVREKAMEILFHGEGGSKRDKKGGNLKFTHLEHEKDAEGNHQGLQYSFIGFDELTHFLQSQFLYLIGRLRSEAEVDSFLLATTNPDNSSWVYNWVSWYLKDQETDGTFDDEKLGRIRYFLIVDDSPVFADTAEELAKAYPDLCYQWDDVNEEEIYIPPLTFCFIGGTIFDNPALIRLNPKYLAALKAQSEINRRRLLDGDWLAKPEGSGYFSRSWLHKLPQRPLGCTEARAWDVASEEPSDKNRFPDFTASVKGLKSKNGDIILVGDYHPKIKDKVLNVTGRFRFRLGARDKAMVEQAKHDGTDCHVILPLDPAAAGKVAFRELAKQFTCEGFTVKQDPMPNNKSKLKKFEPLSSAAENGQVFIVESSFEPTALAQLYKELEEFDGERSTSSKKDDLADSSASLYNYLVKAKVRKPYVLPSSSTATNTTLYHQHKSRVQ